MLRVGLVHCRGGLGERGFRQASAFAPTFGLVRARVAWVREYATCFVLQLPNIPWVREYATVL